MIDQETTQMALTGLFGSAVMLVEDIHPELVERLTDDRIKQAQRCQRLRRAGLDLLALAEAASVVVRRSRD